MMLVHERHIQILRFLQKEKVASLRQLKDLLYVSEATLRRDLSKMEQKGLIQRTHGGAILTESSQVESSILIREQKQVKEKKRIAQACLKEILPNSSIFIDSSSTVGQVLYLLNSIYSLTIITNGLNNASIASNTTEANIYLTSGIIFTKTNSLLGSDTIKYINNFYCDVFLFSCSGLSLNYGVMEASFEQKQVKHEMLSNSKLHILLVDHTKFDKIYMTKTCDFEQIDIIITDKEPSQEYVKLFNKVGVELIIA